MILPLLTNIVLIALQLALPNTGELVSNTTNQFVELPPLWEKEIVAYAEKLPIQSDGRVKPLSTYSRFLILRLSGKTSVKRLDGKKLSSTEWFLDCLFYPEIAKKYPVFIVQDETVLENLGIQGHGKKRDRYAYNELVSARNKLMDQAQRYSQMPPVERTRIQEQTLNLADNLLAFEEVLGYLDFTRFEFSFPKDSMLSQFFPNKNNVPLVEIVKQFPDIKKKLKEISQTMDKEQVKKELEIIRNFLGEVGNVVHAAEHFTVVPPSDTAKNVWSSPIDSVIAVFDPSTETVPDMSIFFLFNQLVQEQDNREQFQKTFLQLVNNIIQKAEARGEYKKIPVEVFYYKGNFLFYSQWIFFLAVVMTAIWWLSVDNRYLKLSVISVNTLALLLLIGAITFRCIIRGRPPVTTLYETILFSTAVAVILAFIVEWLTRDGISLSLASFLGLLGLFLANRYEMIEGTDTMPSLVAVLDTNFWLTAHVTTIVIGYGAGLLASAFGHIWILGKLLKIKRGDKEFYNRLSRGIYGIICFCFFFSLVGTVLGGIWALQSWGRFWGWDPKENGALLIVLWCLVVIHANLGRMLGQAGRAWGAVILGIVVSFSWWGVNLLGVGLHSYGFTRGAWNSLLIFWLIETVVVILGAYLSSSERKLKI